MQDWQISQGLMVVQRPNVVEKGSDLQVDKQTVLVEEKVAGKDGIVTGKEQEGKEHEYD